MDDDRPEMHRVKEATVVVDLVEAAEIVFQVETSRSLQTGDGASNYHRLQDARRIRECLGRILPPSSVSSKYCSDSR